MTDAWLEELSLEDCLEALCTHVVGRMSVVVHDCPVILPVNFRLAETSGRSWLAVRTRPGNVLDHGGCAAFEIDGIDPVHHQGWSVLVRGTLHHVYPDVAAFRERFDPEPWITEARDSWLIIDPFSITGRRLHSDEPEWAFHARGYL